MIFSTEPRSEVVRESQRGAVGTFTSCKVIKTAMMVGPGTISVAVLTTESAVLDNKELQIFAVIQSRKNATKCSGQQRDG